jgi:hypothetical protein
LKFFNAQLEYVAEPGEFRVQIGLDSQDVKEQSFELLSEQGSGLAEAGQLGPCSEGACRLVQP